MHRHSHSPHSSFSLSILLFTHTDTRSHTHIKTYIRMHKKREREGRWDMCVLPLLSTTLLFHWFRAHTYSLPISLILSHWLLPFTHVGVSAVNAASQLCLQLALLSFQVARFSRSSLLKDRLNNSPLNLFPLRSTRISRRISLLFSPYLQASLNSQHHLSSSVVNYRLVCFPYRLCLPIFFLSLFAFVPLQLLFPH